MLKQKFDDQIKDNQSKPVTSKGKNIKSKSDHSKKPVGAGLSNIVDTTSTDIEHNTGLCGPGTVLDL